MARPSETYRGARRNAWRADGCPDWAEYRLDGSKSRQPFDYTKIKLKPYAPRGWPYKQGGRLIRNKVKVIWSAPWSVKDRIAAITKMVAESQRLRLP